MCTRDDDWCAVCARAIEASLTGFAASSKGDASDEGLHGKEVAERVEIDQSSGPALVEEGVPRRVTSQRRPADDVAARVEAVAMLRLPPRVPRSVTV